MPVRTVILSLLRTWDSLAGLLPTRTTASPGVMPCCCLRRLVSSATRPHRSAAIALPSMMVAVLPMSRTIVMPGFMPGIHVFLPIQDVDGRDNGVPANKNGGGPVPRKTKVKLLFFLGAALL